MFDITLLGGLKLRKRIIEEPKRFVADCTNEFHNTIKVHCAKTGQKMKEFCIEAIKEKYEREKG